MKFTNSGATLLAGAGLNAIKRRLPSVALMAGGGIAASAGLAHSRRMGGVDAMGGVGMGIGAAAMVIGGRGAGLGRFLSQSGRAGIGERLGQVSSRMARDAATSADKDGLSWASSKLGSWVDRLGRGSAKTAEAAATSSATVSTATTMPRTFNSPRDSAKGFVNSKTRVPSADRMNYNSGGAGVNPSWSSPTQDMQGFEAARQKSISEGLIRGRSSRDNRMGGRGLSGNSILPSSSGSGYQPNVRPGTLKNSFSTSNYI